MIANHRELRAHSGPHFDHWRRRCMLAFGVTIPYERDELPQEVSDRDHDL